MFNTLKFHQNERRGNRYGHVAKVLDCSVVISEIELQLSNYPSSPVD